MDDLVREFAEAGNTLPVLAIGKALIAWPAAAPPLLALIEAYADGSARSEPATAAERITR